MLQGLRTGDLRICHTPQDRCFVALQPLCEVHGDLLECYEIYIRRCISFFQSALHCNMYEWSRVEPRHCYREALLPQDGYF